MENFFEEIFANTHSEPATIALSSSALVTAAETVHLTPRSTLEFRSRDSDHSHDDSQFADSSISLAPTRESGLATRDCPAPLGTNASRHLYLRFALTPSN